uniref:Zmp:0000001301 n=1 Tax=Latimeria chalumnae TaxID=7897 RepID=H3AJA2_LATCH
RYGHAVTLAGNIAFLFGGCSTLQSADDQPQYFNDFYMLTVSTTELTWEPIPQQGQIPSPRTEQTFCVVKGKLYLFGGSASPNAEECIPGVFCFDIGSLMWQKLITTGIAPQTLKHSSAVIGDNIYVFGGIRNGKVFDDLYVFNTISLTWTPVKTTGSIPAARFDHISVAVGELIYLFGGCAGENVYYKDVYVLDTATLTWQQCEIKGDIPSERRHFTFTAHHDKDIYLFGGSYTCQSGNVTSMNDVVKLSLAKMKWKMPLYVGIPPVRRHSHAAFILHSHLYVFGGVNEEQEFNDILVMKLINPSDRQPIMKEILSEFGIHGVSHGFSPTKIPKVKYELTEPPFPVRMDSPPPISAIAYRDFKPIHDQVMDMITRAFAILDTEFQKLDKRERELYTHTQSMLVMSKRSQTHPLDRSHKEELQELIEKHKIQNEAWLKARAEENDKERKELCKLREEVLHEQGKLKEAQESMQKRSQQLLSLMQQFKGM